MTDLLGIRRTIALFDDEGLTRSGLDLEAMAGGPAPTTGTGALLPDGNRQRKWIGAPAGRAVAQMDQAGADKTGVGFLAGDVLLARLDRAKGEVWLQERLGKDRSGVRPWKVGNDVQLSTQGDQSGTGIVLRGASQGKGALKDHVFVPFERPIVLHHRSPNPPANSTMAYDPHAGSHVRAELSDALRIEAGPGKFCPGTGVAGGSGLQVVNPSAPAEGESGPVTGPITNYWVMLNATQSGGKFSGFLASVFKDAVGMQSAEASGPLTHATKAHEFVKPQGGKPQRPGAIHNDALWTRGSERYDAPLEILDEDEPDVGESDGHPVRVSCMLDRDAGHGYLCGPREGLRRWHVRIPVEETPPCSASRPAGNDSNGNPERVFYERFLYAASPVMSPGMVFIPPPGLMGGG